LDLGHYLAMKKEITPKSALAIRCQPVVLPQERHVNWLLDSSGQPRIVTVD